jgi:hypothetical protein
VFLRAIKTQALGIVRTHYREFLSPESEYENQEGYWQLIAENVAKALEDHSFLQASATDGKVSHSTCPLILMGLNTLSSPRHCLTTQPSKL